MRTANKMTNRKYKFIYKTTNNINGKIYIGQHITDRLNDGYKGSGIVIEQVFKKYGKHNFKIDILEFYEGDSKEEFNNLERSYIEKFDSINPEVGYNRTLCCGGGFLGEEVYKKRFYRHSEEAKRKIGLAHKGKVISKESIEKMRKTKLGKINNNRKKKTIEERKKRVISRKRERPILQYDLNGNFIREWESVCEAGKFYGLCYGASGIRTACNNPNRTCKGFKWKYKETNEERENIEIASSKRSYEVKYPRKGNMRIEQYDKDMNFINTYDSFSNAARSVNLVNGTAIKRACDNFPVFTARGYYWKRIY